MTYRLTSTYYCMLQNYAKLFHLHHIFPLTSLLTFLYLFFSQGALWHQATAENLAAMRQQAHEWMAATLLENLSNVTLCLPELPFWEPTSSCLAKVQQIRSPRFYAAGAAVLESFCTKRSSIPSCGAGLWMTLVWPLTHLINHQII